MGMKLICAALLLLTFAPPAVAGWLDDAVQGVREFVYTPCELFEKEVEKRKERRKEVLAGRVSGIIARSQSQATIAKRSTPEAQRRAKRREDIDKRIDQLTMFKRKQTPEFQARVSALIKFIRDNEEREDLEEEKRVLLEADKRDEVCGE
jgi:hypothetical protein